MSAAPTSAEAVAAQAEAALARLPPRLRSRVVWLLSRWPGRIAIRTAATCIRVELFDRSMTIAAQFFTSVFPVLILLATWFSGDDTDAFADAIDLPDESRAVLDAATVGASSTAFGVIGTLIVLVSATSLSRALTRAFAAIWDLPRPKSRLGAAWRWLAVVVGIAISLVVVRALSGYAGNLPPRNVWQLAVAMVCDLTVAVLVPWVLLSGAVTLRRLAPGALLFATAMLAIRPATGLWLPRALDVSAERYGSIGVAFTFLAWLYVVSLSFLVAAVVGEVVATDSGGVGAWIRGHPPVPPSATGSAAQPAEANLPRMADKDTYTVQRTTTIAAPAEQVYEHVADFHRWPSWSPWEHIDPQMQRTYSGAASGTGAAYAWSGNRKAGQGRMEITEAVRPSLVQIGLLFEKPFEARNVTTFAIEPDGAGSRVAWTMTGERSLATKVLGVFKSMDQMIGPDFEKGLARLKATAEGGTPA